MNDFKIGSNYYNWKIIGKASKYGYCLCECQCKNKTRQELRKSRMRTGEASKECKICREQKTDISNQTINNLLIISKDNSRLDKNHTYYLCKCLCGNPQILSIRRDKILSGLTQSCGCVQLQSVTKNLLGQKFNDYTVVEKVSPPEWESKPGAWWKLRCDVCGEEKTLKGIHITAERVGFCSTMQRSNGEQKIAQLLYDNNIKFIEQYSFHTLSPNKIPLRFDFAIVDDNQNVKYLIEYNGQQHYNPVNYFGGEEKFKKQQENDQLKIEFCENNSIPLIIMFL